MREISREHRSGDHLSHPGTFSRQRFLYWPDTATLFVGDVLVTWPKLELGWRGLTEYMPQNLASVRRMVAVFESRGWPIRRFASGHGSPYTTQDGLADFKRLLAKMPDAPTVGARGYWTV